MTEPSWHSLAAERVLQLLETSPDGLSEVEAARRLAQGGPNQLPRPAPVSALKILADQLTGIVVLLLAAAALVSLALGDVIEAAAIAAVLILNTVIGFVTELRARRAMAALLQFETPRTTVLRSGIRRRIESALLVPGDRIELRAGQAVPADGRLLGGVELRTAEAALTGESLPTSKHAAAMLAPDTPLAERRTMLYMGTVVASGTATAVVVATGAVTELGRISTLVSGIHEERTPLERRLDVLGRRLVWMALAVAAFVGLLEALHGAPFGLVVETAIALAVAAVPEALPAVATISLAVGLRRMAARHALVRRLPAVEALGSTTVICTDKTRTLTSGQMTVVRVWSADVEYDLDGDAAAARSADDDPWRTALMVAARASRPQLDSTASPPSDSGHDPVDSAILFAAARLGIDVSGGLAQRQTVAVVPFSSERKLMAAFDRVGEGTVAYVKGAPGRVIDLAGRVLGRAGERAMDDGERARLIGVNEALARKGLRVLAVATGAVTRAEESALDGLTFIGFLGFMDPPAAGVKATLGRLRAAGLRTVMITGDQRLTAQAVGRDLGLLSSDDQILDARELHGLSPAGLSARLAQVGAFSRVTPEDKLIIVTAFQARGDIVAMIGDGVNDAAALKKADVGVAMGIRGTDVAKEAAAIVLQDDRFETIAAAVEEGRIIYDNIRKFVFYLFSCNLAEILVLLVTGLTGLAAPLLPLQILWLNIVTDTLPALALAVEPGDADGMRRPPRDPQAAILSRTFVLEVALYAALISSSTLAGYYWAITYAPDRAVTMAFMTLALAQILHLGNARSDHAVVGLGPMLANPYAVGAVILSVGLQLAPMAIAPLGRVLHVVALGYREWSIVFGVASVTAVVGQAIKLARSGRPRPGSAIPG